LVAKGHWNFRDQSDCVPVWSFTDSDCSSYGVRSYHADLSVPPGLDTLASCKDTPAIIDEKRFYPDWCELVPKDDGTLVAKGHWNIYSEASCMPQWVSVSPHPCHTYNKKRYTAILEGIPWELDQLKTCYEAPLQHFRDTGISDLDSPRKPALCGWDNGRVVGTWYVEHSDCRPVLHDMQQYGCVGSGLKRFESEVVDFGPNEEWYHLCIAIPFHWEDETYLPVKCEDRKSWSKTRRYALYNIPSHQC